MQLNWLPENLRGVDSYFAEVNGVIVTVVRQPATLAETFDNSIRGIQKKNMSGVWAVTIAPVDGLPIWWDRCDSLASALELGQNKIEEFV